MAVQVGKASAGPRLEVLRKVKVWSPDDAREVLSAFAESGLPLPAFARRHGLVPQRLAWWQKRLAVASGAPTLTLVPVTVRAPRVEALPDAPLSIVLHGGAVRLDIAAPHAISPAWLATLVGDLAGGAP